MSTQSIETLTTEAGIPWINASGAESGAVSTRVEHVGREIARWIDATRGGAGRPSLFNRQAYVAPDNPYALMETARKAVENDDIVSGVCDVVEGLMYQGIKWESEDPEDADVFNQISRDLNLDWFVRQWHREEFTYSQVVVGLWWGRKSYKIRGKTDNGTRRKKTKSVIAPVALTYLDPRKVVPLQPGPFGQDRLAWHATEAEMAAIAASADGAYLNDRVLAEFTTGKLTVSKVERAYLGDLGIDPDRLLGLNPGMVFRVCRTKSSYERFPAVRLKSTFTLLDLKQQLMEADRVSLVGAANFILLVRQGSKEEPAQQVELDNLRENFKVVAKLPVVIGDHRLSIDIITPDQDQTLQSSKYDTLDRRILNRTLGALTIGAAGSTREGSGKTITRGIARELENRRHMMKRAVEEHIARAVVDHPGNDGVFSDEPNLTFTPRNVQLDSDAEIMRSILTLRSTNEISRESTLEYFGFDQTVEALRRELEADRFDDIFKTQVPYSAANPQQVGDQPPQVTGQQGGRPAGGGDGNQSVQGQVRGRTGDTGNPRRSE